MESSTYLLDTHSWIWLALERDKINTNAELLLREAGSRSALCISAISLFEVANLVDRNRIDLTMSLADWFQLNFTDPALPIVPVTPEVALASLRLPREFHRDPNDRLIAATAIAYDLTICTYDQYLVHYGQEGLYKVLGI